MNFNVAHTENQEVKLPFKTNITLKVKREDTLHAFVSGNKFRKLKYNFLKAKTEGLSAILTFGGAFSNHIAAVAYAGRVLGFKTIGVIRGEELEHLALNSTLQFAKQQGMEFKFVSRNVYREKESTLFLSALAAEFGEFYLVPEGGTNALAVKGCEEILCKTDVDFDVLCCAVGTGGTISGIINSAMPHQQVLGFPALKGSFLHEDISKFAVKSNWKLIDAYHFGGYAKINAELVHFINAFKNTQHILLDPVYTGKMLYGIFDLIKNGFFPEHSKILAMHTGGLQGIAGMNAVLKKKKLPTIEM